MTRCDVPGCPNPGNIRVPVGPDIPPHLTVDEDGEPVYAYAIDDPAPTYVVGNTCQDHIEIVKAALRERHQPRRQAMREGRP